MSPRFVLRQESDRLANRKVVVTTLGSIVVFGAAIATAGLMLAPLREGRDNGSAAPSAAPATIGSVEQSLILGPPRGLDMRREQHAALDRWGWVDRDAGIARIPVERAMDLVADGGTP